MPSAIDPAVFEELQATAGAEFVRELIDTFLAEAPAMLGELREAFDAGDAERFRRTAHSLKSNGNTFGALALGALAWRWSRGRGVGAVTAGGPALDSELERRVDEELARFDG
jgi:HPt (histidine-containing phosphotransfer) domain-containing protein